MIKARPAHTNAPEVTAYARAEAADEVFSAALRAAYGKHARHFRYAHPAEFPPDVAAAYAEYVSAMEDYGRLVAHAPHDGD